MTTTAPEFTTLREKIAWEKAERAERYARFAEVFQAASEAGWDAHEAALPTPMGVYRADPITGAQIGPTEVVMEGVCGFAWVTVRPGTGSFARWLVKEGHARKAYQGGVQIWVRSQTQSYDRKMAYAQAMADVLLESGVAGARVYAGGRLD